MRNIRLTPLTLMFLISLKGYRVVDIPFPPKFSNSLLLLCLKKKEDVITYLFPVPTGEEFGDVTRSMTSNQQSNFGE